MVLIDTSTNDCLIPLLDQKIKRLSMDNVNLMVGALVKYF